MQPIIQLLIKHVSELESQVEEYKILKEKVKCIETYKEKADRFYCRKMSVEMVAHFHEVHCDTIRRYIKIGLIEKHPESTDARMLIRASDVLALDFKELKRQYRLHRKT